VLDEVRKELTFAVPTGGSGENVTELRVPADQGIAGWVLKNGKAAIVNDVKKDRRFYAQIDRGSGFSTRSILAVPLNIRDRAIGVVEVINKRRRGLHGVGRRDRHGLGRPGGGGHRERPPIPEAGRCPSSSPG
jgi:GAF domain-containing protein